jgi:hypothetical protein
MSHQEQEGIYQAAEYIPTSSEPVCVPTGSCVGHVSPSSRAAPSLSIASGADPMTIIKFWMVLGAVIGSRRLLYVSRLPQRTVGSMYDQKLSVAFKTSHRGRTELAMPRDDDSWC